MNIALLQSSFEAVRSIGLPAIAHFYNVLLTEYPDLQETFHGVNMKQQQEKLFNALAFVIKNLEAPEKLVPAIEAMGKRHAGYNVESEDYDKVGDALLKTFAHYFQDDWTTELEVAWGEAYGFLAATMIKAGMEEPAA